MRPREIRAAIDAHGGVLFKTVGDAGQAAFPTAPAAVAAALDAQLSLVTATLGQRGKGEHEHGKQRIARAGPSNVAKKPSGSLCSAGICWAMSSDTNGASQPSRRASATRRRMRRDDSLQGQCGSRRGVFLGRVVRFMDPRPETAGREERR